MSQNEANTRNRLHCIVCGFTFGVARSRLRALILGLYHGNHLVHIGRVGSGLSSEEWVDLRIRLEGFERLSSPFALSPSIPGIVRWGSPALVCRIQYREGGPAIENCGNLCLGNFDMIRPPKSAARIQFCYNRSGAGRAIAGPFPRKVRTPQSRVLGNTQ